MKIIICGIGGRMGNEVQKIVESGKRDIQIVAGFDIAEVKGKPFPCFTNWDEVTVDADVIIDFSNHLGTKALLSYAVKKKTAVILATTGHSEDELKLVDDAAKGIAIFKSANMSLGVALLVELAKKAVGTMIDADIEIVETHHNRKLDAPSGTALMLAEALKKVREKAEFVFGRHGQHKREKNEIGIHSIRMGNVVGQHEVIIGTDNETITIKHEAHDRALFAEGAIVAAEFICGKEPGLYDMQAIVKA